MGYRTQMCTAGRWFYLHVKVRALVSLRLFYASSSTVVCVVLFVFFFTYRLEGDTSIIIDAYGFCCWYYFIYIFPWGVQRWLRKMYIFMGIGASTHQREGKRRGGREGGDKSKTSKQTEKKKKFVHTIKSIPSNLKTNCPQLVLIQRSIEDLYTKSWAMWKMLGVRMDRGQIEREKKRKERTKI